MPVLASPSSALSFRKISTPPVIKINAEKLNKRDKRFAASMHVAGDYYKISFTDNGIGFDQVYADEIFVVFKRLHSYHEFKGTGVGLSICKKIVENHNGFIIAESKIDDGATFIIGLPEKPQSLREQQNIQV